MAEAQHPYLAVMKRAGEDEAFRARLKADPHAAIAEVLGRPVPSDFRIDVVENTARHVTLVLPPATTGELSDSELEGIAGGRSKGGDVALSFSLPAACIVSAIHSKGENVCNDAWM